MGTKIVERLRANECSEVCMCDEAANEIERLNRELISAKVPSRGCVCPPTSEQTCMSQLCPRRSIQSSVFIPARCGP